MVNAATLLDVPTPALVLDRDRLRANANQLIERARPMGVAVRPHMKTLKSADAARLAVDPAHGGIAAATLNEARYFAQHGFDDIQIAVCLPPSRIPEFAGLLALAPRSSFFIDSLVAARATAEFATQTSAEIRVWIEIDSGGHRTGVTFDDPGLIDIAQALGASVRLEGVATHAGQSYHDLTRAQIEAIAEQERHAVVSAATRLRRAGFECAGVSAGSTPTTAHARSAEGLTEWRAGVYLAGDLFQAGIGSMDIDDIALSVVATVISQRRDLGQIVVDAGGLALSKDRSTSALQDRDAGYGIVTALTEEGDFGSLRIDEVHQEHGVIRGVSDRQFAALPLGARVRVVPNHACMTAAMYDEYLVTEGGIDIRARWPRTNGWS